MASFFTGLDAESYDRTYSDRMLVARMVRYFAPQRRRLVGIAVAVVAMAAAGAAAPVLVAQSVDRLTRAGSPVGLPLLTLVYLLLGLVLWGGNWARRRLASRAVGDVMLAIRRDAFTAAARQDMSFYDEFASGRVASRITSDTQEFANVVVLLADLANQLAEALILFGVLLSIEPRLVPWVLGMIPIFFLTALSFRQLARRVTRRGMRAMANVNAAIKESISGINVAKNFRQEARIYGEFAEVNRTSYRVNVTRGFVLSLVFPVLNALAGAGIATLVFVGGRSVAAGAITAGAWYLFATSLDHFFFPVLNLSAFWSQIQAGLTAAERVFALLDAEPRVRQTASRPVPRLRGEIRFEGVSFEYLPGEGVLGSLDLHIRPGEDLALVGHTGAGKSSIAKLIARFYEFQGGRLRIDGQDIRTFDLREYRRQLGIVSQVPFLFSGTVADNIRYARHAASDEEILRLARRIGDGEWLETLPQGLATEVGERGGRLSMGQRQLVALLRVLVQRPAIFILDEATASVDPFTESQIQEALGLILAEATSIVIAHRLFTVRSADRILVLRQGKVIEEGDHASLLAGSGHYAELYNTYFRHQELDYRPFPLRGEGDESYLEVRVD
jgi:ATP-binding cassette subfamily B protein